MLSQEETHVCVSVAPLQNCWLPFRFSFQFSLSINDAVHAQTQTAETHREREDGTHPFAKLQASFSLFLYRAGARIT